ncbi:MAG: serine hydrolase domain-containing protein [Rhodothermales bacterium]
MNRFRLLVNPLPFLILPFVILALLLSACSAPADLPPDNKDLPRSTPEAQGVSSEQILAFLDELDAQNAAAFDGNARDETGFHSIMILRNGHVLAEGWWAPYEAERKHRLYSLSKSFTSTAVGFAVNEGLFSVDDPVISFFPNELPEQVSDKLAAMTVHDLLIMSTGQESEDRQSDDWAKTFLSIPVVHDPGSVFLYNTSATFMLSAIVQRTSGSTLMEYLAPRFFEPLGIEDAAWLTSPQGYNTGGYGLSVKTEDIAKLGQFYLQKGNWKGEQLLPESWIEQATSSQIDNNASGSEEALRTSDWAQGYGYQFWQTRNNAYRGDGAFGQYSIVIPELNVVIAATAGSTDMQRMLNLMWTHLYPAFKADPLPANKQAHAALNEKLASLSLLPASTVDAPEMAASVSSAQYALEENIHELDGFSLTFMGNMCQFSFTRNDKEERITCGLDHWMPGSAMGSFLPGGWITADSTTALPVAASGRWIDAQTFKTTLRFVEAPDYFVFTTHFDGNDVTIKRNGYGMFNGGDELTLKGKKTEG